MPRVLPLALGFVLVTSCVAYAGELLRLAPPFSDGMVVQHDRPLVVRGWDSPGQTVTVVLENSRAETKAAEDGRWKVEITPPAPGGPYEMQVTGSRPVTVRNILSGEVWLAAGQSNMAWPVSRSVDHEETLASMPQEDIRFFRVPFSAVPEPQETVEAQWEPATAETVGDFSGVAYHFARNLRNELRMPVGILEVSRGATPILAFLPVQDLRAMGLYDEAVGRHTRLNTDWERRMKEWEAGGQKARKPMSFGGGEQHLPAGVDNGMVHPLKPFPIRGVIWYQGEEDTVDMADYPARFARLVESWRRDFGDPKLPVYFVQLADQLLDDKRFAEFRALQEVISLTVPGVDMVVSIGAGRPGIHPPEKVPIGERLARMALAQTHGRDLLPGGPRLIETNEQDGALMLRFDRVGEGLQLLPAVDDRIFRWVRVGNEQAPVTRPDGSQVPRWQRFDKYIPAKAEVVAPDTLRVALPADGQRVDGLEYNILGNAQPHLFNSENLPASPFRVGVGTTSGS